MLIINSFRRYLAEALMPKGIGNNPRYFKASNSNPGQAKQKPIFIESVNESWHAEEASHRQNEKRYWKWSLALSGWAVAAAFFGSALAYSAFIQARRQADAAEAANRAWIKPNLISGSTLAYAKAGAHESFAFGFYPRLDGVNIGNSPSFKTSFFWEAIQSTDLSDYSSQKKDACVKAENVGVDKPGQVIFPKESITEAAGLGSVGVGFMQPPQSLKTFPDKSADNALGIVFAVVGCVVYRLTANGTELHHSAFAYQVLRKLDEGRVSALIPVALSLPANQIILVPIQTGIQVD